MQWKTQEISIDAARPGRCAGCGVGCRRDGLLLLYGHGKVHRCVLGPLMPGEKPEEITLVLRRYRCQECGAVMTVGPRGLVRGRLYAGTSIAYALALSLRMTQLEVRAKVSSWKYASTASLWRSLRRWCEAALAGTVWRFGPAVPRDLSSVIAWLEAHCPDAGEVTLEARAFAGAAHL